MSREEFVNKYREEPKISTEKAKKDRERARRQAVERERYTAKKGTIARAKRRRKIKNRIATLILASAVGIGGITVIGHLKGQDKDIENITKIAEENGIDAKDFGLSDETMQQFAKYDEYFSKFDKNDVLTDEMVLNMSGEIEKMNYLVIKEKMASLLNEDVKNVELHYTLPRANLEQIATIVINKDKSNEKIFSSNRNLIFSNENTIPNSVENAIYQIEDYSNINDDLKNDKITKVNAVKKLKKLYQNISDIASSEFIKDEKGNITLVHYENEQVKDDKQQEER